MIDETTGRSMKCICGKISFSKKDAITKMHFLEKKGNARALRVYQCREDDRNWHLTKTNKYYGKEYEKTIENI